MRWMKAILDIFLPRVCITCGRKLFLDESFLCLHCLADIPMTHFWERSHNPMGDRFNGLISQSDRQAGERYAYACALFFFENESPYRHIPYNIKYGGRTDVGRYFGQMLGRRMAASGFFGDVDCIVPVPLHWRRKWKRGYNQAEVIARGVAAELGVPVRTDLLRRTRHTDSQTRLEVEEKKANVNGAFKAVLPASGTSPAQSSVLRHILLVDDVFTTGSTLFACFTALREVFPPSVRISVATLAFVGE